MMRRCDWVKNDYVLLLDINCSHCEPCFLLSNNFYCWNPLSKYLTKVSNKDAWVIGDFPWEWVTFSENIRIHVTTCFGVSRVGFNTLSANIKKWLNTLKKFVGKLIDNWFIRISYVGCMQWFLSKMFLSNTFLHILLLYDSYNYCSNHIFSILLILKTFFIVPPPCLDPGRGKEKNLKQNETKHMFWNKTYVSIEHISLQLEKWLSPLNLHTVLSFLASYLASHSSLT